MRSTTGIRRSISSPRSIFSIQIMRRADPAAGHHESVVVEVVEVDHGDRAELLDRLERGEDTDRGVAAAAGAQDRAPDRHRSDVRSVDLHDAPSRASWGSATRARVREEVQHRTREWG